MVFRPVGFSKSFFASSEVFPRVCVCFVFSKDVLLVKIFLAVAEQVAFSKNGDGMEGLGILRILGMGEWVTWLLLCGFLKMVGPLEGFRGVLCCFCGFQTWIWIFWSFVSVVSIREAAALFLCCISTWWALGSLFVEDFN